MKTSKSKFSKVLGSYLRPIPIDIKIKIIEKSTPSMCFIRFGWLNYEKFDFVKFCYIFSLKMIFYIAICYLSPGQILSNCKIRLNAQFSVQKVQLCELNYV